MSRKRFTAEQIVGMLLEAEIFLSQGQEVSELSRSLGITEQTYYRWRRELSGIKVSQSRYLKELQRKSTRLRRASAQFLLDRTGRLPAAIFFSMKGAAVIS